MRPPSSRLSTPRLGEAETEGAATDQTGLKGVYVFYVEWDEGEDFLLAMQQQLGVKLEPQKGPVDILVIDHVEKPKAN